MCGGDVICSLCVDIERMFGVIWTSVMFRFVYLSICFFIQYGLLVWFLRFFVVTTHVDFLVSCFGCSVFSIGGVYYWVVPLSTQDQCIQHSETLQELQTCVRSA